MTVNTMTQRDRFWVSVPDKVEVIIFLDGDGRPYVHINTPGRDLDVGDPLVVRANGNLVVNRV